MKQLDSQRHFIIFFVSLCADLKRKQNPFSSQYYKNHGKTWKTSLLSPIIEL